MYQGKIINPKKEKKDRIYLSRDAMDSLSEELISACSGAEYTSYLEMREDIAAVLARYGVMEKVGYVGVGKRYKNI